MFTNSNLPNESLNRTMYIADLVNFHISEIFATHESISGNSILTEEGKVMRCKTNTRVIMHEYDFARLAIKQAKGETDDQEYKEILKSLNLRKIEGAN